jgi:hypothetical protein
VTRACRAWPTRFTRSFAASATELRTPPRIPPGAPCVLLAASFAEASARPNHPEDMAAEHERHGRGGVRRRALAPPRSGLAASSRRAPALRHPPTCQRNANLAAFRNAFLFL